MAIKTKLSYAQIGHNLTIFKETVYAPTEVPFLLLSAIGVSTTLVAKYRKRENTVASYDGLLIKRIISYKESTLENLVDTLEQMKTDEKVLKAAPALLIVSDGDTILAYDPIAQESYENISITLFRL